MIWPCETDRGSSVWIEYDAHNFLGTISERDVPIDCRFLFILVFYQSFKKKKEKKLDEPKLTSDQTNHRPTQRAIEKKYLWNVKHKLKEVFQGKKDQIGRKEEEQKWTEVVFPSHWGSDLLANLLGTASLFFEPESGVGSRSRISRPIYSERRP